MRRALILGVCLVLAVGAFIVARGSSGDGGGKSGSSSTTAKPSGRKTTSGASGSSTPTAKPQAAVKTFTFHPKAAKPGPPRDVTVTKGDKVKLVVAPDVKADAHLHGYEIEKPGAPGKPAVIAFTAKIEGVFKLELHSQPEQVLAELQVQP